MSLLAQRDRKILRLRAEVRKLERKWRALQRETEALKQSDENADLRARLADAKRVIHEAGEMTGWPTYDGVPPAARLALGISDLAGKAAAYDAARAALAQAKGERDALASNVADLTASLRQAQETIRQREAAQRAAEASEQWITQKLAGEITNLQASLDQRGTNSTQVDTRDERIAALTAALEAQIHAAYVAQEAQIAQGWKLHESETALKRLVNALVRCESNRGRFACTEVHDSRCPKSRATRAEDWRGEWICACGADELDQAIEAAARVCGLDAARG